MVSLSNHEVVALSLHSLYLVLRQALDEVSGGSPFITNSAARRYSNRNTHRGPTMRHLTAAFLPLVLLTALPAHAQMVTISPEQIGRIFCIGSLGNDMAPVEALLTPDLAAVIADAWVKDAQAEAANPGDKPPLGDGIPWRSYPDYADGCAAFEGLTDADEAFVEISYSFASEPSANYTNTLVLKPIVVTEGMEPFWRIDDIELLDGGTLRSALAAAFAY